MIIKFKDLTKILKLSRADNALKPFNFRASCSHKTMIRTNGDFSKNKDNDILSIDTLNPAILEVEYAVRGPIVVRAAEIQKEIDSGIKKPFSKVIRANIGDCHAVGQTPITFIRQVLAGCISPSVLTQPIFPVDVVSRAGYLLKAFKGSLGCYTESTGTEYVRKSVAKYIQLRDGYESDHQNIALSNGASSAIKVILYSLIRKYEDGKTTGIMVPIPQYPLYSATISEFSGKLISYYLDEAQHWGLDILECERALLEGSENSHPKVMVVINPGNPTGQILSYENMVDIVKFCHKNRLILLADEVYQENIYDEAFQFHSFKKVVRDCGFTEKNFSLVSFHSISKGYYGECGLRGGYMELFGFKKEVKAQIFKLLTTQLSSSSCGQVVMETVVNPPKPCDPSYEMFASEREDILSGFKSKADFLHCQFNSIPGITCNKIQGALYAFPRLHLPESFIKCAKDLGMQPDEHYCFQLLEKTGICVVPGSGFKQLPNTYHFRTTILPPVEEIQYMVKSIKEFTQKLFEEYQ